MGAIKTVVKAKKTSTAISAGVKGEQTDNLITGVHLGLVGVIALFGIGAAVFSMMATASLLVDIASVSTIALVFLAIFQRQRLENLGDIREQSEILAEKKDDFKSKIVSLRDTIDSFSTEINGLQYVTKDLDAVAKRYGTQTDKMVNVIKETAEIQKKIKRSQEAHVMQIVIKDILRADRDHNFELDESELEGLKRKLSLMPDVKLDSANFDALTKGKNGLSLKDVVEMFRNLLSSDDLRDEEKIFHLEKGNQKPWYQL